MAEDQPEEDQPQAVYVLFNANVTGKSATALLAATVAFSNEGVRRVHLLLSSGGGSVFHGLTLYNMLRAMPFHLVTHNVGTVDSVTNVIFLAGDERYAAPHSTFLFHGVRFGVSAQTQMTRSELIERLGSLEADQNKIAGVVGERTSTSAEEISRVFDQGETWTPEDALGAGMIHEIRDAEIPEGARIIRIDVG